MAQQPGVDSEGTAVNPCLGAPYLVDRVQFLVQGLLFRHTFRAAEERAQRTDH